MHPESGLRVECYAGYRGEETPRRFVDGDRRVEVTEILDRRRTPDHRSFKIAAADGSIYWLRHDVRDDSWEGGPA